MTTTYSLTPEDRLSNHSSHHTCFATFDCYAAARAGAATVILTPSGLMMPGSLSTLLERAPRAFSSRRASFVEEEFRFRMQPSDFVVESFQTVTALAALVRRRAEDGEGGS